MVAASVRSVVVAGGGTGGHLIPALAVARELASRGVAQITFIGTPRGIETTLIPQAGFPLRLIEVGGLKHVGFLQTASTLLAIPRAIVQSRRILKEVAADVVFGIGGYASGPVLAAAALTSIPIALLEVNAKTGLANRLAARWVKDAAVNFPETARDFRRAAVTGVPVRAEFFTPAAVSENSAFGPPDARARVLVFGGSRGARAINTAMVEVVRIWKTTGWGVHLIHQTGAGEYNRVRDAYVAEGVTPRELADSEPHGSSPRDSVLDLTLAPFISDMAPVVKAADLIVSRSGASTLGELAAAGKPALLIPLPTAADNHQLRNAQAFERAGAAVVMEQRDAAPERLAARIREMATAPAALAKLGAAARAFARPNAAGAIADLVLQVVTG